MGIKVGTTTVIDDNANLSSSVGGLKTVNGNSLIGSGNISAGASTTYGDTGTYVMGMTVGSSTVTQGSTYSGSSIKPYGMRLGTPVGDDSVLSARGSRGGSTLSGTWRAMGRAGFSGNYGRGTLFVRIS